jgi:hypothetical protein
MGAVTAGGQVDREEFLRRRARRNRAIMFVLLGVVALFYALALVRMGLG